MGSAGAFQPRSAIGALPGSGHDKHNRPGQSRTTSRNLRRPSASGALARRLRVTPALAPQEEETLSWRPRNCSFRRRRDPPRPSVRPEAGGRGGSGGGGARAGARPRLTPAGSPQSRALLRQVARGLADAQDVLSSLPSPELFPGVLPTLELLSAAERDVAACVSAPRPGPAPLPARSAPLVLRPGPPTANLSHEARNGRRHDSRPLDVPKSGLWSAAGGGGGGEGRFPAAFINLLFSLQLELVRPGSRRKSMRRPRRRPQTRTAVSGAGGKAARREPGLEP